MMGSFAVHGALSVKQILGDTAVVVVAALVAAFLNRSNAES